MPLVRMGECKMVAAARRVSLPSPRKRASPRAAIFSARLTDRMTVLDAPVLDAVERPALLKPPPISKGDAIGVVAPSYSPRVGWLQRGVKALERAGFEVLLDPELGQLRRFARAEDERRAENLMGMWIDPRVKAVIGGTGGYGAVRMLPYLDPDIFRLNPKAFVGYSDITA